MEEEIVVVPGDDFDPFSERFIWNRPMVTKLIEEYKRVQHAFKDSGMKKKDVWRKIAQRFAEKGYPYITDEMCDKKWRNLKKTFKEIYIGQHASNSNSKSKWCYYDELKDIFSKDPNIVSAASVAVSTKPYLPTKKIVGSDGKELEIEMMEVIGGVDGDYFEDGEAEIVDGMGDHFLVNYNSSSIQQQAPVWFTEFLQQYRSDEEKRTEMLSKMHADILAVEQQKCALLTMLIERLGGSPGIDHTETLDSTIKIQQNTEQDDAIYEDS